MEKVKADLIYGESVLQIVLNAPKANILDLAMMRELQSVLDGLRSNQKLKLITFEGEGAHFCFGASVAEHKKEQAADMLKNFHKLFYSLADLNIPTLAKISGQCLGGGMELALMCNILYADQSAVLGQPEIILGVLPPPASLLLPLKLGSARAEELLITGKSISAEDGASIGLVNAIYTDKEALNAAVNTFIEKQILPKSASSLRYALKAARAVFNATLLERLPIIEKMYVEELMETKDANEGIHSFLEKRKPDWENC